MIIFCYIIMGVITVSAWTTYDLKHGIPAKWWAYLIMVLFWPVAFGTILGEIWFNSENRKE